MCRDQLAAIGRPRATVARCAEKQYVVEFHGVDNLWHGLCPHPRGTRHPRPAEPQKRRAHLPLPGRQEVNTSPTQSPHRHVINFGQIPLEEAETWPDLLAILRGKVKPERDKNKREQRRKYWWQFGEATPALYAALAPLQRCLVTANVTKHLCFSFQPVGRVFSNALYVFPLDSFTALSILQSRIHEPWARRYSSTLETRLNYSASDCFATFPFPAITTGQHTDYSPRAVHPTLEAIGQTLSAARADYMREHNLGLTKLYNALKDPTAHSPALTHLRELHEQLDTAVAHTYGWQDLETPPFCPQTPAEHEALTTYQEEIINRLYTLNQHRAAPSTTGKGAEPKAPKKKTSKLKPPTKTETKSLTPTSAGRKKTAERS